MPSLSAQQKERRMHFFFCLFFVCTVNTVYSEELKKEKADKINNTIEEGTRQKESLKKKKEQNIFTLSSIINIV